MSAAMFVALLPFAAVKNTKNFPDTPLFRGIATGDYDQGQLLLRQRIAEKYKVGDTEIGFETFLKSQGLITRRITNSMAPDTPIYGESEAKNSGFCDQMVRINWRADKREIMKEIIVSYSDTGCL